jgi:two-component system, OmpR family, KDP operon response regulator KdpE
MTTGTPLLLVVDDEPPIRKFLRISLGAEHYEVIEAANGAEALRLVGDRSPDLVILDLGLPDVQGEELIEGMRAVSTAPIIVLSIRAAESQKIAAFDAGASDYVTKPFSLGELTARIRALLRDRRSGPPAGPIFEVGKVRVDITRHCVHVDETEIKLTPKEFDLLAMLIANHGRIVTHRQLLHELWGKLHDGDTQYLRVYVGQLRQKLGDDPAEPRCIATEPGIGYRFIEPDGLSTAFPDTLE